MKFAYEFVIIEQKLASGPSTTVSAGNRTTKLKSFCIWDSNVFAVTLASPLQVGGTNTLYVGGPSTPIKQLSFGGLTFFDGDGSGGFHSGEVVAAKAVCNLLVNHSTSPALPSLYKNVTKFCTDLNAKVSPELEARLQTQIATVQKDEKKKVSGKSKAGSAAGSVADVGSAVKRGPPASAASASSAKTSISKSKTAKAK